MPHAQSSRDVLLPKLLPALDIYDEAAQAGVILISITSSKVLLEWSTSRLVDLHVHQQGKVCVPCTLTVPE
jgi:hypothetical protein